MICHYLLHDALLIVIPQGSAQLVVVHGWPILLDPPQTSHLHTYAQPFLNHMLHITITMCLFVTRKGVKPHGVHIW